MDKPRCHCTKSVGDIKLCVDMRRDNEAITRERFSLPTVDELVECLNFSSVFSKLDLRWDFHLIESQETSLRLQQMTAYFATVKELSFGVNAAPEKYHQHIITQAMAGPQGVNKIADALITYSTILAK